MTLTLLYDCSPPHSNVALMFVAGSATSSRVFPYIVSSYGCYGSGLAATVFLMACRKPKPHVGSLSSFAQGTVIVKPP